MQRQRDPTVVLEGGLGQGSAYFARIAPKIASTTRVCAYDRAGRGRSEAVSTDQDAVALVDDLHSLLVASGNPGPYVLADHSAGGLYVRVFAATYPNEVAGVVLLDAQSPHATPAPTTGRSAKNPISTVAGMLPALARVGVARLLLSAGSSDLPAEFEAQRHAQEITAKRVSSFVTEFIELGGIQDAAAVLPDLGDREHRGGVKPSHVPPRGTPIVKTARDQLDILTAYQELGSYRAAAALCGTTHKTVRRVIERRSRPPTDRPPRPRSTEPLRDIVAARLAATDGRISAKRLLPLCRAAGYEGSARHLRRAVAEARREHRRDRRVYRPWQPVPGEHLVIDWGVSDGLHVFCAVLAWSRVRFVRFATDETQATTLRLLAECFDTLGGVPAIVLTDRMGCLTGGVVANVVVPAPGLVRFAANYGFRPDFCEASDPESKGTVENLVGYAKRDLLVGLGPFSDVASANTSAVAWCAEVNARLHSETSAVPEERLATERTLLRPLPSLRPAIGVLGIRTVDRLRTFRFGSAHYSVPGAWIGKRVWLSVEADELVIRVAGAEITRHPLVAPGELSIHDEHHGRPARPPIRAIRPRTPAELALLSLGPVATAFLRAAAASGATKLPAELALIADLERAHGRPALVAALERGLAFRRFRAADVRAILATGSGVQHVTPAGAPLTAALPAVSVRSLAAYALEPVW